MGQGQSDGFKGERPREPNWSSLVGIAAFYTTRVCMYMFVLDLLMTCTKPV